MNELQPFRQNDFCIDRGLLVSLHDGELNLEEQERINSHIATCPECAAYERSVSANHQEMATLMALLEPLPDEMPDTNSAFSRFRSRIGEQEEQEQVQTVMSVTGQKNNLTRLPSRRPRRRRGWLIAAVAVVLAVLLLMPNASVLASQFLSLFSVQQFQPVSIDPQTFRNGIGEDLQSFGDVELSYNDVNTASQTQAQAQKALSFKLLLPAQLLPGVSQAKQFDLLDSGKGTFTFDAVKARAYLKQTGQGNVSIPAQLDGSAYTITIALGVAINYSSPCKVQTQKGSAPNVGCTGGKLLYIAEIPSPVIQSSGKASLEDLRDFVMSLPKLSPEVRLLIQNINLQSGVIPLPIPPQVQAQRVTVQGTSGLLMTDAALTLGGVLWQKNGIIYAIAGEVSDGTQLLACANSFH